MSVEVSVSISHQQNAFARKLVQDGQFSSLSAVVQRGLELVRTETETADTDLAALKELLEERLTGPFLSKDESHQHIENMIARKKAELGL